jgi:nitrogen regulatory protein P-II 1
MLQLVTAIIKPHKVDEAKEALEAVGVHGLTITEVKGYGRQGGHVETYRGAEYKIDFVPKVRIEVLCADEDLETILTAITDAAHTGKIGDGKVWVAPIGHAIRIRTGERGPEAL